MMTDKNIGRCPSRSSKCKTEKAGSQIASSKDLKPLDELTNSDIPAVSPEFLTTGQAQLGFPDRVYLLASVIFQNNYLEKPVHRTVNYGKERRLPLPEVKDEEMQRAAYELVFNTFKYQELLEEIIIDSCFYLAQPMPNDQMGLVAVMLFDFQDRKFLPRERQGKEEEIVQEVKDVESFLLRYKTNLAASLARYRVKHNLSSIDSILPKSVKTKQDRSSNLPLYAWVNTLTSSLDEVQSVLKGAGFSQVKSIGQLEGQTFCQDPHCGDILVFPAQLKAQLYTTKLLSNHKLVIQDKSCSLGPNAVCSLLPEEGDVLMLGLFSGFTVSHAASLIAEKHKGNGNVQPTVYVCVGDHTDAQKEKLQWAVTAMGCKNVTLIPEVFQSLACSDKRLQKVRVILLTPKCSVSAVSNPVEFILQENGDTVLLQDLSQSSIAQSKLEALVAQQRKNIDHALKFPKVLAVVYSTCSSYQEENEYVVSSALEHVNALSEQEGEPKQANFRLIQSPFNIPNHAEGQEETEPFFMLEPSEQSNGCFLAVLIRELEPVVKELPHEVLMRANAKGILDRICSNQPTRKAGWKKSHGYTKVMAGTTHARTSQPHLSHERAVKESPTSKAQHLQASKNTVSSSFSYSKQENSASEESITPVLNTTTSTTPLDPTPPPATQVARPRRAHREVLKLVELLLPRHNFPDISFPPQPSKSHHRWMHYDIKVPLSRSSAGLFKDAMVGFGPLFHSGKHQYK
ncbi:putative methyltransferase NSUN7 isoform X1 [Sebastes umbrosus]|uniref:putative methyltransferase NSUN7 isoform X1 n=1 Tax=Sebastes umbrosus TaxID=72105 RepID=UPI00189C917D|nr:putative methyltransferase NSUN7 isoform X1 [Sebastes umbrosus]